MARDTPAPAVGGARRRVDVVNISSTAGRVARPGTAVYNLTKFGVTRDRRVAVNEILVRASEQTW